MRRNILLTSIFLLSSIWVVAQYDNDHHDRDNRDNSDRVTVEGCVSEADGNFTLTNPRTGITYQLTGDTDWLRDDVGHTLRVRGYSNVSREPGSMSAQSGAEPTLRVFSVRDISDDCRGFHDHDWQH